MIQVRPAVYTDCSMWYVWAMEPSVREQSVRSDFFSYAQHCEWWDLKFNDPKTVMYVGATEDGVPFGQVRYGKDVNVAEVAISVAPEFRGHGYAVELLQATEIPATLSLDVKRLWALILRTNIASIKTFTRAGYTFIGETVRLKKTCLLYERIVG